jgi:solute carrier family 25 phosphate transporter 3
MSPYRANPFFSTTSTFFLPSVGDKVDQAIEQSKQYAHDAQVKANQLAGKADMKVQDAKEAVKQTVKSSPTGIDLYSR